MSRDVLEKPERRVRMGSPAHDAPDLSEGSDDETLSYESILRPDTRAAVTVEPGKRVVLPRDRTIELKKKRATDLLRHEALTSNPGGRALVSEVAAVQAYICAALRKHYGLPVVVEQHDISSIQAEYLLCFFGLNVDFLFAFGFVLCADPTSNALQVVMPGNLYGDLYCLPPPPLVVKPSPVHGLGLFACRRYNVSDEITEAVLRLSRPFATRNVTTHATSVVVRSESTCSILFGIGAFVNCACVKHANVSFFLPRSNAGSLTAVTSFLLVTRPIDAGDELFAIYDSEAESTCNVCYVCLQNGVDAPKTTICKQRVKRVKRNKSR